MKQQLLKKLISKNKIMKLPYADEKGCSIIKSLKKYLEKTLPANIWTKATTTPLKEK